MNKRYITYRQGNEPGAESYQLWPLYGHGMENFGKNGHPIEVPFPEIKPGELLIRHDACSLCFSDIKVIRLGEAHPRIYRNMQKDPVVLGHEVAITVVKVGEALQDQYQPGDRFIIQADIFVGRVGYAYGYEIQGGLSQYNVIDHRVLNGDYGSYLIPIRPSTGYAEAALVEPWACVTAAYNLGYRQMLKAGGTTWFVGPDDGDFTITEGFDEHCHPAKIKMTEMNGSFGAWLRERSLILGINVEEIAKVSSVSERVAAEKQVDDIILLSPSADLIEEISPYLGHHGALIFSTDRPFQRKAQLDVGRVHYNRRLFLGGNHKDIAKIYHRTPVRSNLSPGGRAMFIGAGGPMGRMHVQYALESKNPPSAIVCSDISHERLKAIDDSFGAEARARGIEWHCVNPLVSQEFAEKMSAFQGKGFENIIILVPNASLIGDSIQWLSEGGVVNIFAGLPSGSMAEIDFNILVDRNVRLIGHSGSTLDDMLSVLEKIESGDLNANRSIAAVGSLSAAKKGMQALIDAAFPGKVMIFPNIRDLPLTPVSELSKILPDVGAKLLDGCVWTKEAEKALLARMTEG